MNKLIALVVFGIAFGLLEAIVVIYLQKILGGSIRAVEINHIFLNLGLIAFVSPIHPFLHSANLNQLESTRESTTIIMLITIAYLSGRSYKQKLGAFLMSFATWDLCYYLFLKILTGWPKSLLDMDIYFLIPVPWIGPIVTPLVTSLLFFILGTILFFKDEMRNIKEDHV